MIPRTFPSTYASNGQQQMVVYFLPSIAGLQRWLDYIPVKLAQGGVENSYNNNGYIDVTVVSRPTAAQQAWKEYIPAYLDDAATDAWRVNATGYIPYGYALFGGASMIMDMTNTGALDSRVTFSRTSNATQFDSAGNLVYAPHNLLTFSEQFDNAAWGKTAGTVTANAGAAPNGTITADQIASTGGGAFRASIAVTQGVLHTASVYAKAVSGGGLFSFGFDANPANGRASFNLLTGAVSSLGANVVSASAEALADGWYRCIVSAITTSTTCNLVYYNSTSGANWLVWGAQLNVGTLQPYYPTTVKNALGYSQEFDNAAWTKTNSTITANATAAPDGSVTADKWVESVGAGAKQLFQTVNWLNGTRSAWSIYAKAAERGFLYFSSSATVFPSGGVFGYVNLNTGAVSSVGANCTITATSVGNGWWRCCLIATPGATATNPGIDIRISSNGSDSGSYTGDGTSGIFIWGAQLSDSASLDPYVYNPVAAPTAAAYYGPRFDYDPATLAARGLLIEEQRTNSIRNNTMQGAVAPSTFPTNWQSVTVAGLTTTVIGTGVERGVTYLDVRVSGTPAASSFYNLVPDILIAGAAGQTWAGSFWAKLVAGSLTNTAANIELRESDAAQGFLTNSLISLPISSTLTRYSLVRTLTNASTAFASIRFVWQITNGLPVDFTLRIGLPQMELGAFATSVIPTTTAAATRTADVATMVGANFSNWYNQIEGTIYGEASSFKTSGSAPIFVAQISGGNDRHQVAMFTQTAATVLGGSVQASIGTNTSQSARAAYAYKTNDFATSTNGVAVATDTTGSVPTSLAYVSLGKFDFGGGESLSGHIRRIAYYPTRLTNAQLQAVTA